MRLPSIPVYKDVRAVKTNCILFTNNFAFLLAILSKYFGVFCCPFPCFLLKSKYRKNNCIYCPGRGLFQLFWRGGRLFWKRNIAGVSWSYCFCYHSCLLMEWADCCCSMSRMQCHRTARYFHKDNMYYTQYVFTYCVFDFEKSYIFVRKAL